MTVTLLGLILFALVYAIDRLNDNRAATREAADRIVSAIDRAAHKDDPPECTCYDPNDEFAFETCARHHPDLGGSQSCGCGIGQVDPGCKRLFAASVEAT